MHWQVKKYLLGEARPGMIVGRTVISQTGRIMLSENSILTDVLIERLASWGFSEVEVKELCRNTPEDRRDYGSEQRLFINTHSKCVHILRDVFERIRYTGDVPLGRFIRLAEDELPLLINTAGVVDYLNLIQEVDDYTFLHSVNVGVISGLLAKWLGLDKEETKQATLAGLLHDIGKTRVPLDVLNKPAALSLEETLLLRKHPELGFELLASASAGGMLPAAVISGVRQHHERLDGSGYPQGIAGEELNFCARIIAVADIYDAMTSNRVYRHAVTPFTVTGELFTEMFGKLDPNICTVFLTKLRENLVGNFVRLSDGCEARIIYVDKERPSKPVVQVDDGSCIDLERRADLNIVELLKK